MDIKEYGQYDGVGLAELIRNKQVSHKELADAADLAIAKTNPELNYLAHHTKQETTKAISLSDSNTTFSGVPILIKDTELKNQPFELGSRLGQHVQITKDSEFTKRLKQSGVTIMGISTMPEWGSSSTTESVLYGATRNPWDTKLSAGGSSGGAAVAVACGAVPIAQASDAGGSIRIPAACCGVVGLKPTRSRTPSQLYLPFAPNVSHVITRSVRDTATMLDCLHGNEPGALYQLTPPTRSFALEAKTRASRLTIAYTTTSPSGSKVSKDNIQAVEKAVHYYQNKGFKVVERQLPYDWQQLFDAFIDLWSFKHPLSIHTFETMLNKKSNPDTREYNNLAILEHGKTMSVMQFDKSLQALHKICTDVGNFFTQYDAFISPVITCQPPAIGTLNSNTKTLSLPSWANQSVSEFAPFTPIFNVTGQPAISLPIHYSQEGLPVGVQIAGKYCDEATLLQIAGELEIVFPWTKHHPNVSINW
ncbi:hypothetical protein KO525_10950 [Psychrosphaera sp. B3R10]|uniref:amidase n=1 Tax=unclassified Psychrosphaera TaxID=2641570 RepID=UPI001C07F708|nr:MULTISPECIES: amidase family protein [unclassified Psychrosphaera]MBU2881877.1 hypothetical protein [Psychrosphaera sp. I2R16]MBU2989898.1 hypothetical protein [Psychrosphaera sp. B3R10]MDO6720926.1 amidase family protein [Psychrosphaera sp. 1_MG-2023]